MRRASDRGALAARTILIHFYLKTIFPNGFSLKPTEHRGEINKSERKPKPKPKREIIINCSYPLTDYKK